MRGVARIIADIVRAFDNPSTLEAMLHKYTETVTPWARAAAQKMVVEVANRDLEAWKASGIGAGIAADIGEGAIGDRVRALMDDQVSLIRSLPLEAAKRVHEISIDAVLNGGRASAEEIQKLGPMTKARANLIARTEVGRAASVITQARAEVAGSDGYIWRTAEDSDVRDSHRRMNGKFVRWDQPPTLDKLTGHAGALPNCRCYAEPVLPE